MIDTTPSTRAPRLPGYSALERVGRGGFSSVYRAHQDTLGRDVAVKILVTDLTDENDERRFRTECLVLGRLGSHPNIVDVYDAGVTPDHRPYIVMKYYPGGNLADRLRNTGPIRAAEAIDIITQTAAALDFAHGLGVIHRDIKPDNILIDADGRPVLTDFGVAAIADAAGNYTTSVAFSPAHVAPEVLDNNEYGVASDVYSLASTLYTMLTAKPAFTATTEARRIIAITTQPPPRIEIDGIPAALDEAVRAAMAKSPAARPMTPGDFARTLSAALSVNTRRSALDDRQSRGRPTVTQRAELEQVATDPRRTSQADTSDRSATGPPRAQLPETKPTSLPPASDDPTRLRPKRPPQKAAPAPTASATPAKARTSRTSGSRGMVVSTFVPAGADARQDAGTILSVGGFAVGAHSAGILLRPTGVAVMPDGSIVFSDTEHNLIRRIDTQGDLTTIAGSGKKGFADGDASTARFNHPTGLAVDSVGSIIVADSKNHRIRQISPQGHVSTLAGSGDPWFADGRGKKARFHNPCDVALDPAGSILVADASNNRIRLVAGDGEVTTIAGSGQPGFNGGPAERARFRYPTGVVIATDGALIIADRGNHGIRRIAQGTVTVLAGTGQAGFKDGHGTVAKFLNPAAVCTTSDGAILVADTGNNRIRRISRGRQVSTIAGIPRYGHSDGNCALASFREPHGLVARPDGSIVVADRWNNAIRLISSMS